MLRLRTAAESRWVDLPFGVRVLCRPLTSALQIAAESRAERALADMRAGGAERGEDVEFGTVVMLRAELLARELIEAWEGVGGDDDEAAPCTPDNAAALMRQHSGVAVAFLSRVREQLDAQVAEGNGSGPSPSTTSAAGPDTATDAGRSTESPATTAPTP